MFTPRFALARRGIGLLAIGLIVLVASACNQSAALPADTPPSETTPGSAPSTTPATAPGQTIAPVRLTGSIGYRVVNEFPHDVEAFTQGLEVVGGRLVESTGLTGQSERREVDLASGNILTSEPLEPELFGEGITEREGLLYQLTWKANHLIISDAETLQATGETLRYEGEGWGLCSTEALPGQPFVMSNGSSMLTVRDPVTFAIINTVNVMDAADTPVENLNELECIGDQVLANVWKSDLIVAIDLSTGAVQGVLDLQELGPENAEPGRAILNGIAYRPEKGTYLVTGKLWPILYELELTPG